LHPPQEIVSQDEQPLNHMGLIGGLPIEFNRFAVTGEFGLLT